MLYNTSATDGPLLLGITEASALLGISADTLRNWMDRDNAPPHFLINGRRRFNRQQIVDWANSRTKQGDDV